MNASYQALARQSPNKAFYWYRYLQSSPKLAGAPTASNLGGKLPHCPPPPPRFPRPCTSRLHTFNIRFLLFSCSCRRSASSSASSLPPRPLWRYTWPRSRGLTSSPAFRTRSSRRSTGTFCSRWTGNKVISTMPTVLADEPAARTSSGKDDIVAETEYNPTAGRYEAKSDGGSQDSKDYGYNYSAGSESAGYEYQQSDYGQESSDYGYDSDGYSQDSTVYGDESNEYGQGENGYGYDSDGYGYGSNGYEYHSDANDYGSDEYGNEWDNYSDGQFSRRSTIPEAFRQKANQTPANGYRRGQTHASGHSSAASNYSRTRSGVNRMGTAAAANRRAQASHKNSTAPKSKRRPAQSSRRRVPYGPNALAPAKSRQSPAHLNRRTPSSSSHGSKRRTSASTRHRTASSRTQQQQQQQWQQQQRQQKQQQRPQQRQRQQQRPQQRQRQQQRRPAATHRAKSAPTPPGWRPPASTSYRSKWPETVSADYEDNELRREAHRNQLKYKAKHGYMRRMTPERYTAWQRTRHK